MKTVGQWTSEIVDRATFVGPENLRELRDIVTEIMNKAIKDQVAEGEKREQVANRFIQAMIERDNVTGRCSCWNLGSQKPCGVCVVGREVAEASRAYHATGTPKA